MSVSITVQDTARRLAGSAVANSRKSGRGAHQELVVRVNGVESGLMDLDLGAVLGRSHESTGEGEEVGGGVPDSIMLPKCDSVEHLRQVSQEWA